MNRIEGTRPEPSREQLYTAETASGTAPSKIPTIFPQGEPLAGRVSKQRPPIAAQVAKAAKFIYLPS